MNDLPLKPIDRLIRKSGANRVSEEAAEELEKALSEYGLELANMAKELASHAGRKTIHGDDIKLALKSL